MDWLGFGKRKVGPTSHLSTSTFRVVLRALATTASIPVTSSLTDTHMSSNPNIQRQPNNKDNVAFGRLGLGDPNVSGATLEAETPVVSSGYNTGLNQAEIDSWLERYWTNRKLRRTRTTLDGIFCPKCRKPQRRPHAFKVTIPPARDGLHTLTL